MKNKFELFMGCLGNGITVCNKAVIEHGDYKTIAHIDVNGKITWYVRQSYIPDSEREKIERVAKQNREKYLLWWNSLTTVEKYSRLLDQVPHNVFMEIVRDKISTMEQKVARLEKEYI